MSAHNWERSFALTLKHEGGYSNNPKDPGGATMKGVTQRTYDAYRHAKGLSARNVRGIEDSELRELYKRNYWDAIGGDSMEPGMDFAAYDFAVNSGPSRAAKYARATTGATRQDRIRSLCAARLAFLRGLSTWSTFGNGWSRRVAEVEKQALAMAGGKSAGNVVVGGGAVVVGGGAALQAGVPPIVILLIIAAIAGGVGFFILRKRKIDVGQLINKLLKRK